MKPVPQSQLESFRNFFVPIISEMNLSNDITIDEWMDNLDRGYTLRYLNLYVDSLDNPQHCLVLSNYPGIVRRGNTTSVVLIYSVPDKRGDVEAIKNLKETYNAFAKIHGSSALVAASWKLNGTRPIDSLWLSDGFVEESTTYVKML